MSRQFKVRVRQRITEETFITVSASDELEAEEIAFSTAEELYDRDLWKEIHVETCQIIEVLPL